jgi:branched-chain amino acid transport system ATP-binding protein
MKKVELKVKELCSGYGRKQILFDVSMHVKAGEIVAIIGPNGAGKSTLLRNICGDLLPWSGKVEFSGIELTGKNPAECLRHGVVYSPQGNRVFHNLTVTENLRVGGYALSRIKFTERSNSVLEAFPGLINRRAQKAGLLSGGEQQMLALARVLIADPKMLLLDEPSLGLAPSILDNLFERVSLIARERNIAILLVEQKVNRTLQLADRVVALRFGRIMHCGEATALLRDRETLSRIFV